VAEELADPGGGLGAGEEVALGVVAAELVELGELAGGLDALGDDGQAEGDDGRRRSQGAERCGERLKATW
jgi:hypothetical protein